MGREQQPVLKSSLELRVLGMSRSCGGERFHSSLGGGCRVSWLGKLTGASAEPLSLRTAVWSHPSASGRAGAAPTVSVKEKSQNLLGTGGCHLRTLMGQRGLCRESPFCVVARSVTHHPECVGTGPSEQGSCSLVCQTFAQRWSRRGDSGEEEKVSRYY